MQIQLHKGDCLEIMKSIPDNSIDLVCSDLPYGVTKRDWDKIIPFKPMWEQLHRITKLTAPILLFGQDKFSAKLMLSNEKYHRYNLIWDKVLSSGFLNANKMPLRSHEDILVFYRKSPFYSPQFSVGEPLHGMGKNPKQTKNNNYGKVNSTENPSRFRKGDTKKYPLSILRYAKPHPSVSKHPTEKPVPLLEYLINTYSKEGDLCLDITAGSGSFGEAVFRTKRKGILIEADDNNFRTASERINKIIYPEIYC